MRNMIIKKMEFVILAVFLQSFSFLSIKYAALYEACSIILLCVAFLFIITRAYVWQVVIKCNELSRVYPYNSLVQVLVFIYAIVFFDESVSLRHIMGLGLMISGLYFMGKSK